MNLSSEESKLVEELNNIKDIGPNVKLFQEHILQLLSSTAETNTRIQGIENDIREMEKNLETTIEEEKSARITNDRLVASIQKVESEIKECKEKEMAFQTEKNTKKELVGYGKSIL